MGWTELDDIWSTFCEYPETPEKAGDKPERENTKNISTAKEKKGNKRMKNDNIHMLQYVAGTLYGITLMMDDDQPLKSALASLSEEVSNVVISETIDKDEEAESGKVNIYMDDSDDGK